ncbi:energy-coupling factor transporter transmembrane component T family protein [Microvirga makkahensis]|uniref:Energy-coupling factor transporter transmembrane protein EcfT n=1 Tax=Microvirga makkahensis TaxID=1128670 RepID=A0A7X3MXM2_9HYPH|nr:energy-coupling factor transporter transmembrane protein EcfT [Microvirga makkahensis]MXQ14880.1 energy-coupling factor transporter transmembrane protein EcfT [Microvirga makkahensis]
MISSYVSRATWLHRAPAGLKLVAIALLSLAVLPMTDWRWLALGLGALLLVYASLGRDILSRLGLLKPLLPFLLVIGLIQAWMESWSGAAASVLRILLMVAAANLVTLTTTMQDLMSAVAPVFKPLAHLGVNPRAPALAVALLLRFVPVLLETWSQREDAWHARTGRPVALRLLAPFVGDAMRMADRIAEALEARGFDPSTPSRGKQEGKHDYP